MAQQGRLRSEDPAADDLNLYRYSGNDPINRADPSGLGDSLIVLQPGIEEQEAAEREAVVYAVGAAINAVRALKAGPDTLLTVQPDPAGHPSPSTAAALDASRAVSAAAWAEWYRLRNGGRAAGEQVVKTGNLAAEGDIGGAAGSLTAYAAGATSESLYGTLAVSSVTKLPPPLVQSHLSDVGERLDPESAELGRMAGP